MVAFAFYGIVFAHSRNNLKGIIYVVLRNLFVPFVIGPIFPAFSVYSKFDPPQKISSPFITPHNRPLLFDSIRLCDIKESSYCHLCP